MCTAFGLFDGWREGSLWTPKEGGPIISVTNTLRPIGGKEAGGATSKTGHHASFRDHVHFVRRAVSRPSGASSARKGPCRRSPRIGPNGL